MNFDWQTEEDVDWEVQQRAEDRRSLPAAGRRWLLLLGALALVALAAVLLWREARQRVEAAEAQIAEAVLASDRIARRAATEGDRELLRSVLSGRDRGWLQTQYELLEQGMLFADVAGPLGLRPASGAGPARTVEVNADLNEAVVTAEQAYRPERGGEAVTLQQIYVYRQGRDRWLLAPPLDDFWGAWRSERQPYLTLTYPERDGSIARRLGADLNGRLEELCAAYPKVSCPDDLHVRVRLETDLDSVLALTEHGLGLGRQRRLSLPAPTLVGLPAGDGAYEALLRGYAGPVVTAAVAEAVGYECCGRVLFFEAAVNWQLAEMGLRPWPLTLERYLAAADGLEGPDELRRLWQWPFLATDAHAERWQAHALVEMVIATDRAESTTILQEAMLAEPSIAAWMNAATDFSSVLALYEAWRSFMFERIAALQTMPALPEQELLAACSEGGTAVIQRYDPLRDHWPETPALSGYGFGVVYPLEDDDGVLLTGRRPGSSRAQTLLWRPDSQRVLSVAGVGGWFYLSRGNGDWNLVPGEVDPGQTLLVPAGPAGDPGGQYAPVRVYDENGGARTPALLDLDSCGAAGDCEWRFISSAPVWSPDGEHMLVVNGRALLLLGERDGRSWEPVAAGRYPFWLSDDVYGYVTPRERLVVRRVGERTRRTVLDVEGLLPFLTDFNRSRSLEMAAVAGPPGSGVLALVVGYEEQPARYLLLLQRPADADVWLTADPDPEELTVLLQGNHLIFRDALPSFSPDGRWLIVHTVGGTQARPQFWLFDVEARKDVLVGPAPGLSGIYDWSRDGRWLARWRGQGVAELIAPAGAPEGGPYRRFVQPPFRFPSSGECTSLAWINR